MGPCVKVSSCLPPASATDSWLHEVSPPLQFPLSSDSQFLALDKSDMVALPGPSALARLRQKIAASLRPACGLQSESRPAWVTG